MPIKPNQLNVDTGGALLVRDISAPGSGSAEQFDANGSLKVAVQGAAYDPDGSQKVSTTAGQFPLVSADLVALNSQVAVDVSDCSNVSFFIKNTGAVVMAAGTFIFEVSMNSTDGINGDWVGIQGSRTNSNTQENGISPTTLGAGAVNLYGWRASVTGFTWFRVRTTVAVTATAIARWSVLRGAYATEPNPTVGTHAVTGSGNFTMLPANGVNHLLTTTASTNLAVIKATAASLFELTAFNPTAATIFVKVYNKASAPVLATDVPLYTIPVPAGGEVSRQFGALGKRFSTGLGIAVTGAAAATDATATAAGAIISDTYV